MSNQYDMLGIIRRTKTVDEAVHEFIKQELQSERGQFPDVDDAAFNLITDVPNFRHLVKHRTDMHMYIENYNDRWSTVYDKPTDEQWEQCTKLRKLAEAKYKEAIVAFTLLAREFKT